MREVVIVSAQRSPVGRRKGALSGLHPADLAAQVLNGLMDSVGLAPSVVDDVIFGCVTQAGEQTGNIARTAVLAAGWPIEVPGVTVDRQCGSSQQAISFAAAVIASGQAEVVIAGGVESMTRNPLGSSAQDKDPLGSQFRERFGVAPHQGIGAEMIAEQWGFSRTALDEYSLRSHSRAAEAWDSGQIGEQIVPITLPDGSQFTRDEGIRAGGTLEKLSLLDPAFKEDGVITAGNSSQISDGAASLLLMSEQKAAELGVRPLARVHTSVVSGSDPVIMLTGPIPATKKVLSRAGLSLERIGTFEVNEAFAPVVLAWQKETGADWDMVNPHGGAIALGHPLGASGARLMTDMLHRMRTKNIEYGLQTMCEGGGQANATIIQLSE
ncbi:thiolase family protein [Nesterenkonia muleiensis]|uniref:thiolase family protein n=1 Tax=Nesterenkonia muleiensis TaxID=2282648 RepID=UPI000E74A619|nr:thiolase family protein [Nesterenkonia muleiensis]